MLLLLSTGIGLTLSYVVYFYNNNHYKEEISNFHKNKGKISFKASDLEFFTFIRNKRNIF